MKKNVRKKESTGHNTVKETPFCYDLRPVNNGVKTSFGMACLSATVKGLGRHGLSKSMSMRPVPAHL